MLSLEQVVDIVQRQENPDAQEAVSGDVSQNGLNGADFAELICQLVHPERKSDANDHHGERCSRTKECRVQDEGAFLYRQGDHSAKKKSRRFRRLLKLITGRRQTEWTGATRCPSEWTSTVMKGKA